MANSSFKIDARGFIKDIEKIQSRLDKKQKKDILRAAVQPLFKEMKAGSEWEDSTGEYRQNIKPKTWARSGDYFVASLLNKKISSRVRTIRGKKKPRPFDPFYFRFVEYGAYNTWAKRKLPARNAIGNAITRSTAKVVAVMTKRLNKLFK